VSQSSGSVLALAAAAAFFSGACDTSRAELSFTDTPFPGLQKVPARTAAATALWKTCCARLYGMSVDTGASGAVDPYDRFAASLPIAVQEHLAYDPDRGAECVARLEAAAASCELSEAEAEQIDRACFVFRGTLPPGEACLDVLECAVPDGARVACVRGSPIATAATGTCTVLLRGVQGDLCDPFADAGALRFCDPTDGLFCGASGVCEARRAQGAECVAGSDLPDVCADGLYCGEEAKCVRRQGNGSDCLSRAECLSGTCDEDHCADRRPVPSARSCGTVDGGVLPEPVDAAADGDAADADDGGQPDG
jgi:hypothetical protein